MNKINILGVNISILKSYAEAYNIIINLKEGPNYITVNNVHTVIESIKNSYYKKILINSSLSIPDGKPLTIYAYLKNVKGISRIFGPTLFEKSLEWGQRDNIKHFLFGSSNFTLNKLKEVISKKYPNAKIVGAISPPFRLFTLEDNDKFIRQINITKPDIIWVSLGAPKQEIWMYENYKKLNRGVMIGIGAGFDYLAGNTKHAPQWMKNNALEWLYRLIQEPRRLWRRYLVTNSLFILFLLLETLHIKKFD